MVTNGMATAIGFALFFAGADMFDEMDYSDLNGYGFSLANGFGCVAALGMCAYLDRTKKFRETVKTCYIATAICAILIDIVLRLEHSTVNLVLLQVLVLLLGFFAFPTWPMGLELGVETTFPVAEATSSGVLITCGQAQIFGLGYLMKWASSFQILYEPRLSRNFQLGIDLWCVTTVATAIFTFFALRPEFVFCTLTLSMVDVCDVSFKDIPTTYVTYRRRWLVLAAVCLLAFSNAMIWVGYTSIAPVVDAYYCDGSKNCDVAYWTSQLVQIGGALTGLLGMYITDKHGIKLSCLTGSALNFVGIAIRLLALSDLVSNRKAVHYVGQSIAGLSQSFYLCLSPKVAEFWFPEHQRVLANSVSFIANPVGIILASLLPKLFVEGTTVLDYHHTILIINCVLAGPAALALFMSFFIQDRPPTPPSPSMESHVSPQFWEGLRLVLRNKSFYVQMITQGMATAIGLSFFFAAADIMSTINHQDVNGYGFALANGFGCIAALTMCAYLDRSKKFRETIKTCYVATAICAILIDIMLRLEYSTVNLVLLQVLVLLLGFFAFPTWPMGLELGVETTFPVAEATSSGVLITCSQVLVFGLGYLMKVASGLHIFYKQRLSMNFQLGIDLWCVITVATAIFTFFTLRPKQVQRLRLLKITEFRYKRIEYEKTKALMKTSALQKDVV
uniref:MFS domain-containing protein n=1 Tax=Steinernema glaseri TaxID=37863 RepID=A0A1I7YR41_9BILA